MARTYSSEREAEGEANTQGLIDAVNNAPHWTLSDVLSEMGGDARHRNRELATELLSFKGVHNPTKTQINSQMRSIQRWANYEAGVTGKQSSKPSKEAQGLINRAGRNAQAARDGFSVAMRGDIEVNGYRRNRTANIDLSGDRAVAFLNNPNWGDLAAGYGVDSLHAFGDADISINW